MLQDADGWRVGIVGYLYAIGHDGRELLSYHWHPQGESPITWPHMHVGSDIHVGERWFGKVLLPTGVVGLERVVALAITELGAKPLRDDWERCAAIVLPIILIYRKYYGARFAVRIVALMAR